MLKRCRGTAVRAFSFSPMSGCCSIRHPVHGGATSGWRHESHRLRPMLCPLGCADLMKVWRIERSDPTLPVGLQQQNRQQHQLLPPIFPAIRYDIPKLDATSVDPIGRLKVVVTLPKPCCNALLLTASDIEGFI